MSVTHISVVVLISCDEYFLSTYFFISLLGCPGHSAKITDHRVVCDGSGQEGRTKWSVPGQNVHENASVREFLILVK